MDYLPLVLLALVVVGAAVVFPFLRRLKRAARETLAASKQLETRLQSFQAQQAQQSRSAPPADGAGPDPRGAARDDPWA